MKLLLVEDEKDLLKMMADYLLAQQYLIETAADFHTALRKMEDYDYDCIVIDLNLPGGDGLKLIEDLKRNRKTDGVIIVSARDQLDDKLKGLALGADDYLTKPFHLPELSMRIAAIIRRKKHGGAAIIIVGNMQVDDAAKTVMVGNETLALTRKEYEVLLYFVTNKGRVISKNALAERLWGDDMDLADNYDFIYTHIKNLRKKMEAASADCTLQSIYGMGYKFSC